MIKERVQKKVVFFFLFMSVNSYAEDKIRIPEPVRRIIKLIIKDNKKDKKLIHKNGEVEQEQSYSNFFYGLWQDALEDGVLGGIRWGIAGCCYQVLFVLSGKMINSTFSWWRLIKMSSISTLDKLIGRKKRPNIAQLKRLSRLLQGFNHSLRSKSTCHHVGAGNCLLVQTSKHLVSCLSDVVIYYKNKPARSMIARTVDFCSSHDQEELLFLANLLIHALDEIIEDQSTDEQHNDIIQKVNNVLLILDQLIGAIRGMNDQVQVDSGLSATIDIA